MSSITATVVKAIGAFIATNLDDIVILMLFFSKAKSTNLKASNIVAGQYLGFLLIILASLPGYFGGLILPRPWIGLLGIVPIFLGIKAFINSSDSADEEIQTVSPRLQPKGAVARFLNPQIYQVAAVTIANGGDNISIYVSLFASLNWVNLLITLAIFLLMVATWCGLSYWLISHRLVSKFIEDFGHRLIPFIFIALGVYIMAESGSFKLIPW